MLKICFRGLLIDKPELWKEWKLQITCKYRDTMTEFELEKYNDFSDMDINSTIQITLEEPVLFYYFKICLAPRFTLNESAKILNIDNGSFNDPLTHFIELSMYSSTFLLLNNMNKSKFNNYNIKNKDGKEILCISDIIFENIDDNYKYRFPLTNNITGESAICIGKLVYRDLQRFYNIINTHNESQIINKNEEMYIDIVKMKNVQAITDEQFIIFYYTKKTHISEYNFTKIGELIKFDDL